MKYALALFTLIFASAAWAGENRFEDASFSRPIRGGAIPRALAPRAERGTLDFFPEDGDKGEPYWRLAAHYSKHDLTRSPLQTSDDGERFFETPGSRLSLRRGDETVLRLDVYADAEYDAPRRLDQPWPHLLLEHNFSRDKFLPLDRGPVLFSFDVKINPWENRLGDAYDPGLHCAQTNAYFVIRNVNPDSPDFNEYIWFGVPVFDSRHEIVPPYIALDGDPKKLGTGKLIYTLGGAQAYEKIYSATGNPRSGRWCHGKIDLAAASGGALTAAQERGLLTHTTPADLKIVHFNFGWEVPGTFRCSMEIKNLSLTLENE